MRIPFTAFVTLWLPTLLLGSCSAHLFSSVHLPDRTRPVALIEVRGQPAILGATTAEGIVFLNEENATGPCRVHYFLGPDLVVDDGEIAKLGGVYYLADIALKTQAVSVMTRELTKADELVAIVLTGMDVLRIPVQLANDGHVEGYAIAWPGRELPRGTGIFRVRTGRNAGDLQFVGLASGLATLTVDGAKRRYIGFTGPARMREALATPKPLFPPRKIEYRPDGIIIIK